jgi:5-methylcytosine-specific restriction endonuclease McrA
VPGGDRVAPVTCLTIRSWSWHVLLRDNHRCQNCGGPGNVVDHITPIAQGGSDHPSNLRALCAGCNGKQGAR